MAPKQLCPPRVRYELRVPHPERHLIEVTARFDLTDFVGQTLDVEMAAWSPGSYSIRDHARYVRTLEADTPIRKLDKRRWRIERGDAAAVEVRYRVYGHDLSVRTNHIDDTHAFLHGPALYLIAPARDGALEVAVYRPENWAVHTGLRSAGSGVWRAADIDELLDCPIHLGATTVRTFEAGGRPTTLAVWGEPDPGGVATIDSLVADLRVIVQAHADRFGGVPYDDYTFLLLLAPDAYGGLEHRNSSASSSSPFALGSRKTYVDLLELLSHEFFHVWNGKRIRPAALGPFDYGSENYTRSLWVQEGITSYLDRHTLVRAGLQTPAEYLERIAEDWCKLQMIPGRAHQSVEDSSFDAWIKLYRPDESNVNTTVSYYLKGAFVALALDAVIRERTDGARTIDDAMRGLWERYGAAQRGYEDDAVQGEFERATGTELRALFDACVRGTEDPDLPGALAWAGLRLLSTYEPMPKAGEPAPVWLGVVLGGRRVGSVLDGSPAFLAGLAPGDELQAVDGYQVSSEGELRRRLAARAPGDRLELTVFRRGRLRAVGLTLRESPANRWEIATVEAPTDAQRARFEQWLGQPLPADGLRVAGTVTTWV